MLTKTKVANVPYKGENVISKRAFRIRVTVKLLITCEHPSLTHEFPSKLVKSCLTEEVKPT